MTESSSEGQDARQTCHPEDDEPDPLPGLLQAREALRSAAPHEQVLAGGDHDFALAVEVFATAVGILDALIEASRGPQ